MLTWALVKEMDRRLAIGMPSVKSLNGIRLPDLRHIRDVSRSMETVIQLLYSYGNSETWLNETERKITPRAIDSIIYREANQMQRRVREGTKLFPRSWNCWSTRSRYLFTGSSAYNCSRRLQSLCRCIIGLCMDTFVHGSRLPYNRGSFSRMMLSASGHSVLVFFPHVRSPICLSFDLILMQRRDELNNDCCDTD